MAILSVNEIHDGRGATSDEKGIRRVQRVFHVQTSTPQTDSVAVLSAGGIPRRGDPYNPSGGTLDFALTARSARADQQADRMHWRVTVDYSDERNKEEQKEKNPLLRPAELTRGAAIFQRIAEKATDINTGSATKGQKVAIVNSAGQPFIPPPQVDDARYQLTIVKNYQTYNDDTAFEYFNAVNEDSFFGGDPRTWKIFNISVPPKKTERVDDQDVTYYEVTFEMQYRKDTWDLEILDRGYYKLMTIDGEQKHVAITEADVGQPFTDPPLLDGSGSPLTVAQIQAGSEVYRKYRYYPEKSFASLNIF